MNQKRLISLVLAVFMTLCLLSACTPADTTTSSTQAGGGNVKYQVTLIDPYGEPMNNGVVVKFIDSTGKQVAMQTPNASGVAAKELPAADYTVQLTFSDSKVNYVYNEGELTLSATKNELTVNLYKDTTGSMTLYISMDMFEVLEVEALMVENGMTKIKLIPGQRNYFVLSTRQTGFYEISVTGKIDHLGQYGSGMATTKFDAGVPVEGKENVLSLNLHSNYITETGNQTFVFGIDAPEGTTEAVLNIMRQGDFIITPSLAPWTVYKTTVELKPYTLPAGAVLKDFYMSEEYTLVFNEEDGYYHKDSKDGPLVLLRLGENAAIGCRFDLGPLETIFESNEILGVLYYDENGEFIEKIGFEECLREYVAKAMDAESGLVPLNKELEYILKELGNAKQWWDITEDGQVANSGSFLFWDANGEPMLDINPETAWLYNCCYIEG